MPYKQCFLVADRDKYVTCTKKTLAEADVFLPGFLSYDLSQRVQNFPDLLRTELTAKGEKPGWGF
jgi:hypothetical protein